jgi:hypothetical protein
MTDDVVNYGPLAMLVGEWYGDRGMDIAPEPDDVEKSPYYETITFEEAGDVTNAEQQVLAIVRYHQVVSRKSNDKVFHDQIGYWMWDAATNTVMQSLVIPRAVAVVSTGTASEHNGEVTLSVKTVNEDGVNAIAESVFMGQKARTTAFSLEMKVSKDQLSYNQSTMLDIYGKKQFDHTDRNKLTRVVELD